MNIHGAFKRRPRCPLYRDGISLKRVLFLRFQGPENLIIPSCGICLHPLYHCIQLTHLNSLREEKFGRGKLRKFSFKFYNYIFAKLFSQNFQLIAKFFYFGFLLNFLTSPILKTSLSIFCCFKSF